MNSIIVGTHHYRTPTHAQRVYGDELPEALAEGRITIGQPEVRPGERLLVDREGRYHIEMHLRETAS